MNWIAHTKRGGPVKCQRGALRLGALFEVMLTMAMVMCVRLAKQRADHAPKKCGFSRNTHLGSSGKPVTRLTNANVQAQFADMQVTHNIFGWVFFDFFGINCRSCGSSRLKCRQKTTKLERIFHSKAIVACISPKPIGK